MATGSARLKASWRSLPLENVAANLVARSSHNLALLDGKAYIFGGESQPRKPIGNQVLVVDVNGANNGSCSTTSDVQVLNQDGDAWPCARVGASMVAHPTTKSLFMWGGRAGKEMGAIKVRSRSASINDGDGGKEEEQAEDIWRFDVHTKQWQQLPSKAYPSHEAFPVARSFHTATQDDANVYVHAGCPAQGRLGTLHAFDVRLRNWRQLADAPGPARGGTVLAAIAGARPSEPHLLARWGGFCGHELGGPLDIYTPSNDAWESYDVFVEQQQTGNSFNEEPPKRSVHGFVPFNTPKKTYVHVNDSKKEVVALMFMGEGEGAPKELGHDGAGKFLKDVYALLRQADDSECYSWLPIAVEDSLAGTSPQPRGWFAFDVQTASDGKGIEVVLHGGLNEANERLEDAWVLQVGCV